MRFLLTNDDGIDAPGLQALYDAASQLGEVTVAAPTLVHSGCGHRVTTDAPFAVEEMGTGRFAVAGTPADCVRVALHDLAPRVDWVLSGVNAGGNLGADVYHSGTVAAVREAVLHGVPGVALHGLAADVSWVLAGINAGGNLGADVYHSGTVAAVREAVLHGRPGVALSHYRRRRPAAGRPRRAGESSADRRHAQCRGEGGAG